MNNANEKNVKTNNKPAAKVIAIVLAFALMIATSFVARRCWKLAVCHF